MSEIKKNYSNKDLTVHWEPSKCIHSTICWKNMLPVFNPQKRPWVDIEGASSEDIAKQIDQCPSKALSYEWKK